MNRNSLKVHKWTEMMDTWWPWSYRKLNKFDLAKVMHMCTIFLKYGAYLEGMKSWREKSIFGGSHWSQKYQVILWIHSVYEQRNQAESVLRSCCWFTERNIPRFSRNHVISDHSHPCHLRRMLSWMQIKIRLSFSLLDEEYFLIRSKTNLPFILWYPSHNMNRWILSEILTETSILSTN